MQGAETGARLAEDHAIPPYPFSKGLHDLGNGCYCYLQPDGGWGLSNAGLIEDQGDTLLVDTLMDLPLTREMLDAMRQAVPAAQTIGTLLNTHSNPAHTRGDVVVYVPQDRVVFAGDILFVGGHPAIWTGPLQNWIDACDLMLGWDVEIVVPGHGPITGQQGIRDLKDYLVFVETESRKRYDAGMGWEEAGRNIDLGAYAGWIDRERIVMNVFACYREFAAETVEFDPIEIIGAAGRYFFDERQGRL